MEDLLVGMVEFRFAGDQQSYENQSDNGYREGLFHTKEIMLSMHFAVREFEVHQFSNCRGDIAF